MAEEKDIQSKGKIRTKLLVITAVLVILVTVGMIFLVVSNLVNAKELKKQLDFGEKYLSELKYEQAVAAYLAAIEIDPKCEEAYFALVDIYVAMGEYDKAEEVLREAEGVLGEVVVRDKRGGVEKSFVRLEQEATPSEQETTILEHEVTTASITSKVELETILSDNDSIIETGDVTDDKIDKEDTIIEITDEEAEKYFVLKVESGGIIIVGLTDIGKIQEKLVIPRMINEKPIIEIGNEAFRNNKILQTIELPEGLKKIGDSAFAFCSKLNKITVPNGVEEIGEFAFFCSGIKGVNIPESVKKIGYAFVNGCSFLEEIIISASNQNYLFEDGVIYSKDKTLLHSMTRLYKNSYFKMPDTVLVVGKRAFTNCFSVHDIIISNSLEIIEADAFFHCGIRKLELPGSVKKIAEGSLVTHNVMEFKVADDNLFYKSIDGMLLSKDGKIVYEQVATIGYSNIKIPEGVEYMRNVYLGDIKNLNTVYLPGTLKNIRSHLFERCVYLENIDIPDGVTVIGNNAFKDCTSLKRVYIPSSVINIGQNVFEGCTKVTLYVEKGSIAEKYAIENKLSHIVNENKKSS